MIAVEGAAISAALPKNGVPRRHQKVLPHARVGEALARVRASRAHRATALPFEFLVLTACRSGKVRGAPWVEVDEVAATSAVPPARMKAKLEHRVPLSARAVAVLDEAREVADTGGLVFPSPTGRVLGDSALSKPLRELGIGAVPHGFRSSFRDWATERTDVPREVCELTLSHINSDRDFGVSAPGAKAKQAEIWNQAQERVGTEHVQSNSGPRHGSSRQPGATPPYAT